MFWDKCHFIKKILILFLLLANQGTSQEEVPSSKADTSFVETASTVLPKDTCFFLALPHPKQTTQQFFKDTAWGQLLQYPEIKALFQTLWEKNKSMTSSFFPVSDYWNILNVWKDIFDRGVIFALIPPTTKNTSAKWLFWGEFSQENLFLKHLQESEHWLASSFQQERVQERSSVLTISKFVFPFFSCFYSYEKGRFVLSNQKELVEKVLLHPKGTATNTLFQESSFQQMWLKRDTALTDMFFYSQLEFLKTLRDDLFGSQKIQERYGWNTFKILGGWLGFQNGQLQEKLQVTFPAPSGILKVLRTGKISLSALPLCPVETIFFASLKCSPAKLMRFWAEVSDEMAASTPDIWLTRFQNSLKYSLIEDLFGLFGEEISLFLSLPEVGFLPDVALISPLKVAPEAFLNKLKLFLRTQEFFTLEESGYESFSMYSLQPKVGLGPSFFFVCLQQHLILSYNSLSLKHLIQRIRRDKPSFVQSEVFQRVDLEKSKQHQGFFLLNSKQLFQFCYAPFYQVLNLFPRQKTFEPARLPDAESFSKPFDQMMTFFDFTPTSFSFSTIGDGNSLGMFFFGFLKFMGYHWFNQRYQQIPTEETNENALVQMLRDLVEGQTQFQYENLVDMDQDGMGEYGWIQELAGTALPRTSSKMPKRSFLPKEMGLQAQRNQGIARWKGYYIVLYLPSEKGVAYREPGHLSTSVSASVNAKSANAQEFRWLCYAWPTSTRKDGRCFVVNQEGNIFVSATAKYSGLSNIPSAEACFNPQKISKKEAQNIGESSQMGGESSFDGFYWTSYLP